MLTEIIAVITVILSVVSTGVAAFAVSYSKTLKNIDINQQNYEDVKEWYEKTLEILKEMYIEHAENFNADKASELNKCLVMLSKQIDMSKIYFENKIDGDYLVNKPEIFRGRRPLIADFLILYYDIFQQNKQTENIMVLRSLQRAFSSELTLFLNSNKNNSKFTPYSTYDYNDIVNIKNIDNADFRKILVSEDIVSEIKKLNFSPQSARKYKTPTAKQILDYYKNEKNKQYENIEVESIKNTESEIEK